MSQLNIQQILFKRGNTAAASTYIGPLGEPVFDTGLKTLRIQDGVTPGGWVLATGAEAGQIANVLAQMSGVNANVADITANLNSVLSTVANIHQPNLFAITSNIATLQGNIEFLQDEIDSANAIITSLSNTITTDTTSLQNQITGANAAIANLSTTLSADTTLLQNQITGANASIVTANLALKDYVDTKISSLVNGAPGLLDTLSEIATAIQNDESSIGSILNGQAWGNAQISNLWANASTQATSLASLTSNAASQQTQINTLTAGVYTNSNVAAYLPTSSIITGINANITAANLAIANKTVSSLVNNDKTVSLVSDGKLVLPGNGSYVEGGVGAVSLVTANGLDGMTVSSGVRTVLSNSRWVSLVAGQGTGGDQEWTFDTDGNITLPTNWAFASSPAVQSTGIVFGDGTFQNTAFTNQYSNVQVAEYLPTYSGNTSITNVNLNWPDQDSFKVNFIGGFMGDTQYNFTSDALAMPGTWTTPYLNLGSYVSDTQLWAPTGRSLTLQTDGGNKSWALGTDGSLTFPDTTQQITAWTGNINATSAYINFSASAVGHYEPAGTITFADGSQFSSARQMTPGIYGSLNFSSSGSPSTGGITFADGTFQSTAATSSSYGNSNVAAYLPTYTGTVGATNVLFPGGGNLYQDPNSAPGVILKAGSGGSASIAGAGGVNDFFVMDGGSYNGAWLATSYAGGWRYAGFDADNNAIRFFDGSLQTSAYGNTQVAAYLAQSSSNPITTTGNIGGGNVIVINNITATTFTYPNGAPYAGTYSNSNVASYLPTSSIITGINANVTAANAVIATHTTWLGNLQSNVTTHTTWLGNLQSNVTTHTTWLGNLQSNVTTHTTWLGNLQANVYSNANVASYLTTATINTTGNITAGNISTSKLLATSVAAVGNQVTGIESYAGAGAPYNYSFSTGSPNFLSWYNTYGSNLVGWTIWPTASPGSAVTITAFNPLGAWSLGFSAALGAGPYTAQSANYSPAYIGNVVVTANTAQWTFGNTGQLTLPTNGTITYANGVSILNGIGGTYSNTNVAAYLTTATISTTGNITAGNLIGNGQYITNLNYSSTGNITGTSSNVTLVAGSYSHTFDNTGNITLAGPGPVIPARPAFRVNGTGLAYQTNSNVNLKGTAVTTAYNQGSYFNSTTGIFTAPVGGLYQTTLVARVGNNNSTNQVAVLKNGVYSAGNVVCMWETDTNTGTATHFGTSGTVLLAAGEWLSANVITGACTFDSNDHWDVTFIG